MTPEEAEHVSDLFAGFGAVTLRPMFGGHGVYRDGIIFAIVIGGGLYLKVDADSRARFEAAGCVPFVYPMRGRDLPLSYWSVPAEAMESAEAMQPWAGLAWSAALHKSASAKPRSKRHR